MAITPIDIIIDPPLPTDAPSIFDQKAFAAWAAINGWAQQANALAVQVNTDADRVNDPSVQAVANNIADVMAVAGIEASVTIVATNSANVTAVAANAANINAVAGNNANITAVAGNKTNIDTVAGIAADVSTVAGIDDDVSTVAGAAADVSTVATNISDVQAAAADMAAIKAAPGAASTASSAASTATTKAGEASASALAAAGSASTASTKASEASGHADRAEQAAEDADDILQQVLAHGNGWTPVLAMASDGERRVVQVTDWTGGQGTKPATGYLGPTGIVASIASAVDVRGAAGAGAVSSVAMSAPTGFSVSGSPITTSGTLELSFASGYSLPTTEKQGQWDQAYGWGNHASAGYAPSSSLATVATSGSYDDLTNKPTIPTLPSTVSQAEAEAGTATTTRLWTAQRVRQAIAAWWANTVTQSAVRTKAGTGTMAYRDVTISTSEPSGGADGDFWVQVES